MTPRDAELVEDVVVQVRAALQAGAPAWRRALVRFEALEGCFSTRVFHGEHTLQPLDAVAHRSLFVRLQAAGRQLCGAATLVACDVEIDAGGRHAVRARRLPA